MMICCFFVSCDIKYFLFEVLVGQKKSYEICHEIFFRVRLDKSWHIIWLVSYCPI